MDWRQFKDPFKLKDLLWPHVTFYKQQVDIIRSVWEDDRTVVPAGHKLGKDFVAGFIALAFFLTRYPCRIVTTSVDGSQLRGVLWGEIRNLLQSSTMPLDADKGGPLVIDHMRIRKMWHGDVDGKSYIIGRVARTAEGLSGHHIAKTGDGIPRTLAMADEASGVFADAFGKMSEWADRELWIGNPYDCESDFKWSVMGYPDGKDKGGDIRRSDGRGYERRVIPICAEDSPNVRYALAQKKAGLVPTGEMLVPGVLPYEDYVKFRKRWDPIKQSIGLDGKFYEGKELRLFPAAVLTEAGRLDHPEDPAEAMGIDTGEGGADTAWSIVCRRGLKKLYSFQTPDTSIITGHTLGHMAEYGVPDTMVTFDVGGGGKQAADNMRAAGHMVRTLGFGEPASPPRVAAERNTKRRQAERAEQRYTYVSRRAQMYHEASLLVASGEFAIPKEYVELRRQLAAMPLMYNGEGRIMLPPKSGKGTNGVKTLVEILGCSPDQADSFVLAIHTMLHRVRPLELGAIG